MRLTWLAIAALLTAFYFNPLWAQPDDGRIKLDLVHSDGGDNAVYCYVGHPFPGNQLE